VPPSPRNIVEQVLKLSRQQVTATHTLCTCINREDWSIPVHYLIPIFTFYTSFIRGTTPRGASTPDFHFLRPYQMLSKSNSTIKLPRKGAVFLLRRWRKKTTPSTPFAKKPYQRHLHNSTILLGLISTQASGWFSTICNTGKSCPRSVIIHACTIYFRANNDTQLLNLSPCTPDTHSSNKKQSLKI
jgi:hypothetical protein